MSNQRVTFKDIPHIVCLQIFARIPIEDVLQFRTACRGADELHHARSACDDIIDPIKYLDREFGRGAELMLAMAKSNVYLSGSRALNYFVPGSATKDSDWDFYMVDSAIEIAECMKATSRLGVKWLDDVEMMKHVTKTPGKRTRIPLDQPLLNNLKLSAKITHLHDLISSLTPIPTSLLPSDSSPPNDAQYLRLEHLPDSTGITLTPSRHNDYGNPFHILNGTYSWRARTFDIQLITLPKPFSAVHEFLSGFHSSCIQCFISPSAAVHLYGKLAARHQSLIWMQYPRELEGGDLVTTSYYPLVQRPSDGFLMRFRHWAKYRERGFEYYFPSPLPRRVGREDGEKGFFSLHRGDQSTVVPVRLNGRRIRVPRAVEEWYRTVLEGVRWDVEAGQMLRVEFVGVEAWARPAHFGEIEWVGSGETETEARGWLVEEVGRLPIELYPEAYQYDASPWARPVWQGCEGQSMRSLRLAWEGHWTTTFGGKGGGMRG